MKRVGVAELKNNLSAHLRAVEDGDTVEVTDRGRAIARIVPLMTRSPVAILPARRPFAEIRDRTYERLELPISLEEILRQERADHPLPDIDR